MAAGCGSSASPGNSPTVVGSTSTTQASGGPQSSSPAPTTATGTSSPVAAACQTSGLKISLRGNGAGMSHIYMAIQFTNTSSVACTLYGFPGVSFTGGSPLRQLGLPAAEDTGTTRELVTLAAGATASAQFSYVDVLVYPASHCEPVHTAFLKIYPPNQTSAISVAFKALTCAKPIRTAYISAVRPGNGGSV